MPSNWFNDAIFYHIYPLGLCGAPFHNESHAPVVERLDLLYPWLDHIKNLGASALYLGPVFQSSSHGYDTTDYFHIDSRLGNNETMARFANAVHHHDIRLVLDGVFNHVGREFWAFKDVLEKGQHSDYCGWFQNLNFDGQSPMGDTFAYEGWEGHYSLVKLNLSNPEVRQHLFDAVGLWMDTFYIDGLRLDAADCIDFDFLKALNSYTKSKRSDFWLMGEVVHGDYRNWVQADMLDSVTNYQAYKGLYSSHVDENYFEIAHSLSQQFELGGMYQNFLLYNFLENHDVDRVTSKLTNPSHLNTIYLLLFTMPGLPSIYYGGEWGVQGAKQDGSDLALRPALELCKMDEVGPHPYLKELIHQLSIIRRSSSALRYGDYTEIAVSHQQLAFLRQAENESILTVLNSAHDLVQIDVSLPWQDGMLVDLLNPNETFPVNQGKANLPISSCWGRILKRDEVHEE